MEASKRAKTKNGRQVRSNVKVLLTVFVVCNGVGHHGFLPQDHTVSKGYYLEVIRRLCKAIDQKCTELWKNQSWISRHDNALAYTSLHVCGFLAKNQILIMPQPPYLPDLVTVDFFLCPKLKTPMKGQRFAAIEEIKEKSKQADTKYVSKIGKNAGISVLYLRGGGLL